MGMDKINGSPLIRQNQLDRFQGPDRGPKPMSGSDGNGGGAAASDAVQDKADISATARRLVDLRHAVETGRAALRQHPDARPEKLQEVRERLNTGYYQSTVVREELAARVGDVLLGLENI